MCRHTTGITVLLFVSWLYLMFEWWNIAHISFTNENSSNDNFAEKEILKRIFKNRRNFGAYLLSVETIQTAEHKKGVFIFKQNAKH